jgi:hypothetical protein
MRHGLPLICAAYFSKHMSVAPLYSLVVIEIPGTTRSFVMNKIILEAVFSMIPMIALASCSASSSDAPISAQAETCTANDRLVENVSTAYHTQFATNCLPVGASTTKAPVNHNADTISGHQETPQQ